MTNTFVNWWKTFFFHILNGYSVNIQKYIVKEKFPSDIEHNEEHAPSISPTMQRGNVLAWRQSVLFWPGPSDLENVVWSSNTDTTQPLYQIPFLFQLN